MNREEATGKKLLAASFLAVSGTTLTFLLKEAYGRKDFIGLQE